MAVTTITPGAVIDGPVRSPFQYGLFNAVTWVDPDHWEGGGITWSTDPVGVVGTIGAWQCEEGETEGLPKDFTRPDCEPGHASPFFVYGSHVATPVAFGPSEAAERARASLEAGEEAEVERVLWEGAMGTSPNFSGAAGFPAPSTSAVVGVARALSQAERWLALNHGAQGVIHMSRSMATRAIQDGDAKVSGGRLRAPLGTVIVAGAGYERATENEVVVTGALIGTRSEVFNSTSTPGDLFDRGTNDLYAVAERGYAIGIDTSMLAAGEPPVHKITVTMRDVSGDGGGGGDTGDLLNALSSTESNLSGAITSARNTVTGAVTTAQGNVTDAIDAHDTAIGGAVGDSQNVVTGAVSDSEGNVVGRVDTAETNILAVLPEETS